MYHLTILIYKTFTKKSRETFIRFTYYRNIQEKVEVGRLRRAGYKRQLAKIKNT